MKKFPSFLKLPSHTRFEFTPRYYDPVKEEIEMKIEMAKRQHAKGDPDHHLDVKTRISESFTRKRNEQNQSLMIKLFIVVLLTLLAVYVLKF
ncbi:hypothetical protein R9C00_28010 [Flammeovirgaceae bacterium SG7u.111]|nr:hypothetical protein [Flammeovirgaceae bacterium SG7u.132]WPO35546.1 hypothetical protein R9C00_28010 [Flammeovirgaceae bacterium SG7u.111]